MDWAIGKRGSIDPSTWRYISWECGGTAYTGGLKPPAFGIEGSNPSTPTKFKISKAYCLQALEIVYYHHIESKHAFSLEWDKW